MLPLLRCVSSVTACVLAFGFASPMRALRFTEKYTEKGSHILVVRDCKNFSVDIPEFQTYDNQHPCRGGAKREGFLARGKGYAGDDAELDLLLELGMHGGGAVMSDYGGDAGTEDTIRSLLKSPRPFDEVWLLSGGGHVEAGVGIARILRRRGMTVEIPAHYSCVSACTIAFMGGVLRYIDPKANFQVHSASEFEGGLDDQTFEGLTKDPSAELASIAQSQQIDARYMAIRLMTLFQTTLSVPIHSVPRPEDDAEFCRKAGGTYSSGSDCDTEGKVLNSPHLAYTDPGNPDRAADAALIRREGLSAAQDVLMRIERMCMAAALDDLETSASDLGPRAKAAIKMLRAMYMTSIKDTSYMTHLQLVTMGYVTETF